MQTTEINTNKFYLKMYKDGMWGVESINILIIRYIINATVQQLICIKVGTKKTEGHQ